MDYAETHREKINIQTRWKERQAITKHYWNAWQKEYVNTLRQLTKHYRTKKYIMKGALVIVRTEKTAKNRWPLEITKETHAGIY